MISKNVPKNLCENEARQFGTPCVFCIIVSCLSNLLSFRKIDHGFAKLMNDRRKINDLNNILKIYKSQIKSERFICILGLHSNEEVMQLQMLLVWKLAKEMHLQCSKWNLGLALFSSTAITVFFLQINFGSRMQGKRITKISGHFYEGDYVRIFTQ